MTYRELLVYLQNMEKINHTALDMPVWYDHDGCMVVVDIFESLTSGTVHLGQRITFPTESEEDGEA